MCLRAADCICQPPPVRARALGETLRADVSAALAHLKRGLSALLSTDLPPILSNPDKLWECNFCPVPAACEQLQDGPMDRVQSSGDSAA